MGGHMPASDRSDVARREPGGPASTAKKPVTLQFGVDDAPPLGVTLLCAVQHIGVMAIFLVVPLLLARQAAAPAEVVTSVLGLSMLALGIGTLLQASPRLGSGYLVPPVFTGIYVGPSLQAVQSGGLPLMAGMTIAAGVAEGALSRTVRHLRPFMPPELAGLVIFLTGTTTAAIGLRYLLRGAGPLSAAQWLVAVATLVPMVGLSVWTKGRLRIVCALVGMATGSLAALTTGGLAGGALAEVALGPVVALPRLGHVGWAFDPLLLVPFGIGALAATLKTVGLVSLSQRMNDTGWVRPEMRSITRGVLADGVGTTVSGLFGTVGGNSAPSCVGLAAATGVASRRVAYAIGAILILLAFVPAFPRLFALLPPPVVGSVLVFTACFTLLNGIETIASRMLDTRKTLVIGLAIVAALAAGGVAAVLRRGERQLRRPRPARLDPPGAGRGPADAAGDPAQCLSPARRRRSRRPHDPGPRGGGRLLRLLLAGQDAARAGHRRRLRQGCRRGVVHGGVADPAARGRARSGGAGRVSRRGQQHPGRGQPGQHVRDRLLRRARRGNR
jgi:xanthine/uracil permease